MQRDLPTIAVRSASHAQGFVLINARDYDPERHELYAEDAAEGAEDAAEGAEDAAEGAEDAAEDAEDAAEDARPRRGRAGRAKASKRGSAPS